MTYNAPWTPEGRRRLAVRVVEQGWSLRRGRRNGSCSPSMRSGGPTARLQAAADRPCSSRPTRHRTGCARRSINVALRFALLVGSALISVSPAAARFHGRSGARLIQDAEADQHRPGHWVAGSPPEADDGTRYAAPGQLVHVDIKKQGRIPDGGGQACPRSRIHADRREWPATRQPAPGQPVSRLPVSAPRRGRPPRIAYFRDP